MEILLIMALGGAVIWLKNRVDQLEQRVSQFEADGASAASPPEVSAPLPTTESVKPATPSVPLVRREQESTTGATATPEPQAEASPTPAQADIKGVAERFSLPRIQFDFEDIFGRRLPIWAGGVTLAVAGVFLVRYSIESGLLTPAVRVALAFLFGLGLLGGAEWAYRNEARIEDERVRQALAGAGLATLYAAFYLAGSQYGLIGQTAAFVGLALVTAGAIALSYRFGLPSAVLGLVGGFAAPALVGGDEANLPLLALYLGLVTAGLTYTGQRQQRPWLSIAALVFGLGWGALLLLSDDPGVAELLALGLYFIVLGAVLPTMLGGQTFERPLRLASAFVASVQLALLVDQGGYAPLAWGLYLLLGATLGYFAWRDARLRESSAIAAVVGILLLAQWEIEAVPTAFALVGVGLAAVFAAIPLAHIWRRDERMVDWLQLAGVPLGIAAVAYGTFGSFDADLFEPRLALATATLAVLPALGAWRLWQGDRAIATVTLLGSAGLLAFAALLMATPGWIAVAMAALVFFALFGLVRDREDRHYSVLLWSFAVLSLLALALGMPSESELARLGGEGWTDDRVRPLIRWISATLPFLALAWRESSTESRRVGEALAALLAYGALAQMLPSDALAWTVALAAIAVFYRLRDRMVAQWVFLAIAGLWALAPFFEWLAAGAEAIVGDPLLIDRLPSLRAALLHIAPVGAALAVTGLPGVKDNSRLVDGRLLAAPVALVVAHILFKQVFAIADLTQFVSQGLLERTLWEALLLGTGWLVLRGAGPLKPQPLLAGSLAAMALAHAAWFSGLVHSPLLDRQAIGPAPLANLALAATVVAALAAVMLRQLAIERFRPIFDGIIMIVISIGAIVLLRQAFGGSIPVDVPLGQTEDLLRSLLGILLALAFLFVGSKRGERSWRIGSLVLMLLAVAKVFLFDTAGLEGLLRIASFMALGFSLIGIGWFYSRQLRTTEPQ
ncbi:DUF2339 domain-containing protein [Altererythrobacter arenosus]|uniref:DUF2339 domain-containing protein n=1 Tax=Altererythrobacter arenosus TaxID=3032592 RepID=A0ABY8FVV8_9SPHN|nr:DUF2339 domain-containing protein [Altererythrobacter sp. CAU 1644]WFL78230.1 DUF2339 domain-containing protein [Altererythrobacter sp. CAU 1644]